MKLDTSYFNHDLIAMGYLHVAAQYPCVGPIRVRTADGTISDFDRYMTEWQTLVTRH